MSEQWKFIKGACKEDRGMCMTAIILTISLALGIGSVYFFGKDNPVEEVAEEVIEDITQEHIDLSPEDYEITPYEPPKET